MECGTGRQLIKIRVPKCPWYRERGFDNILISQDVQEDPSSVPETQFQQTLYLGWPGKLL